MCRFIFNQYRADAPVWKDDNSAAFSDPEVTTVHRSLSGYRPTPLFSLPALARVMGVGEILVKDESYRFDLAAFKVLGASYAIYRFLKKEWEGIRETPFSLTDLLEGGRDSGWAGRYTFCTASDGNHGRAVAWTASKLHQKAVVYMPRGTVPARVENIRALGAEVTVIDGTYDEAVRMIARDADAYGWQVISDTAYAGYMTVPWWIMAGYTTMFREMAPMIHPEDAPGVDIVIMQVGVGSFAAAGMWYYADRYGAKRPRLISVEPVEAACFLESIEKGDITTAAGSFRTIMAGLNCGTPSHLAWPIIRDGMDLFLAIPDEYAVRAMRRYYYPYADDPHIVSGESGAAGLAALTALCEDKHLAEAKEKLGLGPDSRILLFNTEGATDPEHFKKIIQKVE